MTYDDLDQVDYGDLVSCGKSSPGVPQEGLIVRAIIVAVNGLRATAKVPGYLEGSLVLRDGLKVNDAVFAKVIHVSEDFYSLDTAFVNQRDGSDEDPDDQRRQPLAHHSVGVNQKDAHKKEGSLPQLNHVYSAIVKITKAGVGAFVQIEQFKHVDGLVPFGKLVSGVGVTDPVFVKVVQVIPEKAKYNCDTRYVDQASGEDRDPTHSHSNEKVKATGEIVTESKIKEKASQNNNLQNKRKEYETRADRNRYPPSDSPIIRRHRPHQTRERSPSDSPIRRRRSDYDNRDHRRNTISPEVIRRRR